MNLHELHHKALAEKEAYAGDEERPLGAFVGLLGLYGTAVGISTLGVMRSDRRLPDRFAFADIALISVATHRLSRLITKDPVTSPLRAPFTRFKGTSAEAELEEEVRGTGARKALGELLTCPFCVGQWVATGFTFSMVVAPKQTRLAATIFTAVSAADVLQYAYAKVQQA
ncbi:uncharacterized protein DUF1360 [Motilibacter peucedani]|uniref:Uncharacterized protein DUF1360 n=1 Tax=Motilibacter peucedani TaxID=598650 RepID=A0A420XQF4_9ACTN|nr:DUF1360 domain-containing protein [Motilibacter peucedani]RKS75452.1 uncharacterized protein DUF1360 [Motilibacter peucedani]